MMAAGLWSAGLAGALLGMAAGAGALQAWQGSEIRAEDDAASAYVEIRRMPLPLVTDEGDLVRYAAVDFALEVPEARRGQVRRFLPEVRHRMNVAAHRTPLAAGADGRIDIEALRRMTTAAARAALPEEEIRSVKILAAQQI